MKWFIAGLAFAAVVALAVCTASVRSDNVERRARLQLIAERLEAARVAQHAERVHYRDACDIKLLVRQWLQLEEQFLSR